MILIGTIRPSLREIAVEFPPKLLLPLVFVLGFVVFLGAVGAPGSGPVAEAGFGDDNFICQVDGPTTLAVGQTALYSWRVQDNVEDFLGEISQLEDEFTVEIDNLSGKSKITAVVIEDDSIDEDEEGFELDEYVDVGPTSEIKDVDVEGPDHIDHDLLDFLRDRFGYELEGNPCGSSAAEVAQQCVIDDVQTLGCADFGGASSGQQAAWADAVEAAMANWDDSVGDVEPILLNVCEKLGAIGAEALDDAGGSPDAIDQISAYWITVCNFTTPDIAAGPVLDDVGFVAVTCFEPGQFKISFVDEGLSPIIDPAFEIGSQSGDSVSLNVTCRDSVWSAAMMASPTPVEIIPMPGSVSHSLVTVTLTDSTGGPAVVGSEVTFMTDRCSIESSAIDSEIEFESAEAVFAAYSKFNSDTATAIENHESATEAPDSSSPQVETVESFAVFSASGAERVVTATVLHCETAHAPGVEPGPAEVTAIVELPGADLVLTVTVAVVGPPAAAGLSAVANPETVLCGEKSVITVTVLDAIGQTVSDHTPLEAVTNFGGVLGGTGAVVEGLGSVTPLSSTVAKTIGGSATIFLITSDEHQGPYEVIVTTGSHISGSATSAPFSVQVTVVCTPDGGSPVTAPSTGTGSDITPPSTGNAGLLDSNSQRLIFLIGGVIAFALAGVATLRFSRD